MNVAVLGLNFKPGTDDLREAPTLMNIPSMIEDGEDVKAWEPVGINNFKTICPHSVTCYYSIEDTADVYFIFTE